MEYDALDRVTSRTTPDDSETLMTYNEAGLLEAVDVRLRGAVSATTFVGDFDYDARGQRLRCVHGNGTTATYDYDPHTFRLARLRLFRDAAPTVSLQDLRYTYDPVGNITQIRDLAQQTIFFDNSVVSPDQLFEYDPLYRLTVATGREHASLGQPTHADVTFGPQPHPDDPAALRTYEEHYVWDEVGNILELQHVASGGNFTRQYAYAATGNRLLSNSAPGESTPPFSHSYTYDLHGNMTSMPHLAALAWDHADRLQHCDLGGGGDVWFVYDASGARVRKVQVNTSGSTTRERIYLGPWEVWRERSGTPSTVQQERETLHVADDSGRICLVETLTVDGGSPVATPTPIQRYQHGNRLGSAALELDETAAVISYEEFHPFGTTSYAANDSGIEVSAKQYRYIGKERDEETGLYHLGARYYASWLARWTAMDPHGLIDGANRCAYCRGNPVKLVDRDGNRAAPPAETPEETMRRLREDPVTEETFKIKKGGTRSSPKDRTPDTGGAGVGDGNRRAGRRKEPPPPAPPPPAPSPAPTPAAGATSEPAAASAEPPGGTGSGASWLERVAAAFAVVGGGRVNFDAEETKLGLGDTENPEGSGLSAAFVIAAVVTKEALTATALGLAGRALGALGSLLRRIGAEGLAGKVDEFAEAVRAARSSPADEAAEEGAFSRIVQGGGLSAHESAGGHLLARHVGQSEAALAARLAAEPRIRAASTFLTRAEAEAGASAVLDARAVDLGAWVGAGARGRLVLDAPFSGGMVLQRGATSTSTGTGVRLVLQGDGSGGWHILTGFPTP